MAHSNIDLRALVAARRGGAVKRMHNQDVLRGQTVAEHSFNVAWLAAYLMKDRVTSAAELHDVLSYALIHDVAEGEFGDVPAPTKDRAGIREAFKKLENEYLKEVGIPWHFREEVLKVVKVADVMEGLMYCTEERRRGNRGIMDMRFTYRNHLKKLGAPFPNKDAYDVLVELIDAEWRLYNVSE